MVIPFDSQTNALGSHCDRVGWSEEDLLEGKQVDDCQRLLLLRFSSFLAEAGVGMRSKIYDGDTRLVGERGLIRVIQP